MVAIAVWTSRSGLLSGVRASPGSFGLQRFPQCAVFGRILYMDELADPVRVVAPSASDGSTTGQRTSLFLFLLQTSAQTAQTFGPGRGSGHRDNLFFAFFRILSIECIHAIWRSSASRKLSLGRAKPWSLFRLDTGQVRFIVHR